MHDPDVDALLAAVEAAAGRRVGRSGPAAALPGGKDNLTWSVPTAAGDLIVQWLRAPRADRDLALMRVGLDALAGFPDVAPDHPAAPRFTRVGDGVVQVMARLPGVALTPTTVTPALLVEASARLAALHRAVDGFPAAAWAGANLRRGRLEERLDAATAGRRWLGDDGDAALDALLGAAAALPTVLPGPRTLQHGDPAFKNFLVAGGEITGLVDYDMLTVDARIVDLADLLRSALKLPWFDAAVWDAVVAPWRDVLDADERAALPDAVRRLCLDTGARYLLARVPGSGCFANGGGEVAGAWRCVREGERVGVVAS